MEIEKRIKSIHPAVLFLIFFSPALAYLSVAFNGGNTVLFEDGVLQCFPFRAFLHSAFANGFSPQWVPSSACGFSLLGEGQTGICFPSTQIIYRIVSAGTGWIIEIISAHIIAFIFCYLFLQHLRVSRVGSLFGASVYAFCSFAFYFASMPAMIWCHSLLPGIFLAFDHFIEGRPFSSIYLIMVLSLLLLTGHPPMIIYTGMVILLFLLFSIRKIRLKVKSTREILLFSAVLLGIALVAVLIASPQLLPMLEEFQFSARTVSGSTSPEVVQHHRYLHPYWGPLNLFPIPPRWGDYWYWSIKMRFPIYALFLSFIGMLFATKSPSRGYFIFLCVFSILMALGPYIGLWKFVHSLPVLKHFRDPDRFLFLLPICVSVFSARGVDHLLNLPDGFLPTGIRRILKFLLLVGLIAVVVFFIRHQRSELFPPAQKALEFSPWLTGLLWLCSIGMVFAAFLSLKKRAARHGVFLGIALTVISLFATLAFMIKDPMVIRDLATVGWKGDIPPSEPQTYRTATDISPSFAWKSNTIHRHYSYLANLTILNGTLTTTHYFSFFPYWSANISKWCEDALRGDLKKEVYLNLSSARWLFLPDRSSSEKLPSQFKIRKVYENINAMPRASVVFSYRPFSDEEDLLAFLESSEEFDPRKELAILRQDAEAWNLRSDANEPRATASPPKTTIVAERPDRIEIEIEPAVPVGAFMVLSDTYHPGWRALVDGVEKKILRVNYAFRGIPLPVGAKRVVFFYDPFIPDPVLPLPTIFLASLGGAMCLRHFLKRRVLRLG